MPAGGQCYEPGPFFPTAPRHVTRLGISRRRNLLLRPDWMVTVGMLFGAVVILCLCVTLLVSLHKQVHIKCKSMIFLNKSVLCRSCSVNMDGRRRSPSKPSIARCSWPTKWTTTHRKVRGWSHRERVTETNKPEWLKTPFSQVEYCSCNHRHYTHGWPLCSFPENPKPNASHK